MNTLYLIIGMFTLGVLIGTYLLSLVLHKKETSKTVCIIQGGFVASALVLVIAYTMQHVPGLTETIVLFVVATLAGLTLILRDLNGKPLSKWLDIGHELITITGFIFLLAFAFL